jgi:hypothetical protein
LHLELGAAVGRGLVRGVLLSGHIELAVVGLLLTVDGRRGVLVTGVGCWKEWRPKDARQSQDR